MPGCRSTACCPRRRAGGSSATPRSSGGGVLAASFDFAAYPHLLEAFPFPHLVEIEATLVEGSLEIATSVTATGSVAVPIAFGFHPYLCLPGVPRAEWVLTAPVHERLVLDQRGLPTGAREPAAIEPGPLGARTWDDAFRAPASGEAFVLAGPGRRLELRHGQRLSLHPDLRPRGSRRGGDRADDGADQRARSARARS